MKIGMTVIMRGTESIRETKKTTTVFPVKSILARLNAASDPRPNIRTTEELVTTTEFLKNERKSLESFVNTCL
jgi:hypothetical protein